MKILSRTTTLIRNGDTVASRDEPIAAPSMLQRVKNVSSALLRWQQAGRPVRTDEEVAAILAICAPCEFWNPHGNLGLGMCRHHKCGCTKSKAKLATEHCPIQKW